MKKEYIYMPINGKTNFEKKCRIRDFPGGSAIKKLSANAVDRSLIPALWRSQGERNGNPLQYSCLGNPMDREAWWATDSGVSEELETT